MIKIDRWYRDNCTVGILTVNNEIYNTEQHGLENFDFEDSLKFNTQKQGILNPKKFDSIIIPTKKINTPLSHFSNPESIGNLFDG